MTPKSACEELDQLQRDVVSALLEAKCLRLSRDVSIQEDAQLSREAHKKVDALIGHLLVGHAGEPCPAGDRPIVSVSGPASRAFLSMASEASAASRRPFGIASVVASESDAD
jgi:hypothetical protein